MNKENEESSMEKLLESWKVGMLYDRLKEYGFDMYNLENLEEKDLPIIFPEKHFYGPLKRFQASHSNWLRSKVPPTSKTTPVLESQGNESDSNDSSEGSLNINSIIKRSDKGVALIAIYERKKTFLHEERLELVGLIAEHLVAVKHQMSVPQFEEVSNQIAMVFMGEKKDTYYGYVGGRRTGLLSIAYYNRLSAEKRKLNKKKEKENRDTTPDTETDNSNMNAEIKKAIEWMEAHNPIEDDDEDADECLLENWVYCYHYRRKMIKEKTTDEVLVAWPQLNNLYGFSLIEADIDKMIGNCATSFLNNWHSFAVRNIKVLRKMIVEPTLLQSLRDLSTDTEGTNLHNTQILHALLHLMAPAPVVLKSKKRFKASTDTAKNMLIKLVNGKTEMQKYLDYFTKLRQSKNQDMQPIIFAFGESYEKVIEFVVSFKDLFYVFETITEAIDAAFKCHLFFEINFSSEHKRFWSLINALFYDLENRLEMTPAISSVKSSFVPFKE